MSLMKLGLIIEVEEFQRLYFIMRIKLLGLIKVFKKSFYC